MAKKINETEGARPEAEGEQSTENTVISTSGLQPPASSLPETYPPCPRCKNTAGKPVGKPFEQIFRGTEKIVTQYIKCTKCGQTYFIKTSTPLN